VNVTILGAGTMGAGIAQACLQAGHAVSLFDAQADALAAGRERIARGLTRAEEKGHLGDQTAEATLAALAPNPATLQAAVSAADVVIEAVSEAPTVKEAVWRDLGSYAQEGALLASNTSSLSITALAAAAGRPERTCGLHFFNPVAVLPLVEVVRGEGTSDASMDEADAFARSLGKTPVRCSDRPGFLVNRLLIPYVNEAAQLLDEGGADAEAIDTAMTLGANMPMGPLALADLIGLDVVLAIMESLHAELGDDKYRPAPRLRRMVRAGHLGRKSGRGFFNHGGQR